MMRGLALAGLGLVCLTQAAAAGTLTLELVAPVVSGERTVDVEAAPGDAVNGYALMLNSGEIRVIDSAGGGYRPTPFLASIPGAVNAYALAFPPDHATPGSDGFGKVYVTYADAADQLFLVEYARSVADPAVLDPASQRVVLSLTHPAESEGGAHHGADIGFGPDGALYMTTGDGDAVFGGLNIAQDLGRLHGKVLRIDPHGDDYPADSSRNYAIPTGAAPIAPGADPAIWASGLRNPFKASWDPITGRYFIADVGEDSWEEINLGEVGGNYGWSAREGAAPYIGTPNLANGPLLDPLWAYPHDAANPLGGFSVTGGEVYRGDFEDLYGQYVWGDFGGFGPIDRPTGSRLWSMDASTAPGGPVEVVEWMLLGGTLRRTIGFGTDGAGNFYISDFDGQLFVVTNVEMALVPLPATALMLVAALLSLVRGRRRI